MNGSPQPLSWLGPCPRKDYTVVASDILQNPSLKRWLGGIDPAWTLLDRASTAALRRPPSQPAGAIRLASNFSPDEIARSAVARNALILLHTVAAEPGLKMTATGNLSRSGVAQGWGGNLGLRSLQLLRLRAVTQVDNPCFWDQGNLRYGTISRAFAQALARHSMVAADCGCLLAARTDSSVDLASTRRGRLDVELVPWEGDLDSDGTGGVAVIQMAVLVGVNVLSDSV